MEEHLMTWESPNNTNLSIKQLSIKQYKFYV